ncbi:hypothetical protein LCGC14_1593510, partial [marine sediment metagenome]
MIIFIYDDKGPASYGFKAVFCPETISDFIDKLEKAERVNRNIVYLPSYGRIHSVVLSDGEVWDAIKGLRKFNPDNVKHYITMYKYCADIVSAYNQYSIYSLAKQRQKDHDKIKADLKRDAARRLAVEHTRTSDPVMDL